MTTPGLDAAQVSKAVGALLKYAAKQKEGARDLLEDDELLHLIIALKKTPVAGRKDKPIRIPLPHPLHALEGAEICLIVKDHKGEGHKAAKARVKAEKLPGVAKVLGVSKLRSKFESHEAKRALCAQYDLFLADARVLPVLPKLLGKAFFRKKKQPIPVDLRGKDWASQVRKAAEATYLFHTGGSCLNIKVASTAHSREQGAANALAALDGALPHIPRRWANIQAVYLKTASSAALPVYQMLPGEAAGLSIPATAAAPAARAGKA